MRKEKEAGRRERGAKRGSGVRPKNGIGLCMSIVEAGGIERGSASRGCGGKRGREVNQIHDNTDTMLSKNAAPLSLRLLQMHTNVLPRVLLINTFWRTFVLL